MSKFNLKKPSNKTKNLAGGLALKHSPEMELIVSVLSTFLEDKFYESGNERMDRIVGLCKMVKPEFLAKLAVVARTDFHLRSVSHLLIGELSKIHKGDNLVSRTMIKAVERVDDLTEIVSYVGKPIPKQIKVGVEKSIHNFNRYQLAKYKGEGKGLSLVDLFNLVHPKPQSKEESNLFEDLMNGKLKNEETWEAQLSSGKDKEKVWNDLVLENKIGYMALLRNLRNIAEQGNKKTIEKACEIIADRTAVKKSKQLPFRFYNAYENVQDRKMLDAIAEAMEFSLDNVPKFEGTTLIGVDTSGSMSGEPIKKASLFASALAKSNNADVILYDTRIKELKYLAKEPVLSLAQKIQKEAMGGGTETSLVFQYASQSGKKYDRIIILSDNESWVEYRGVNEYHQTYRKINPEVYVYAIDLAGYGTKDISSDKVYHLTGWSEKMFDFMQWIEKENQLVDFINQVEL